MSESSVHYYFVGLLLYFLQYFPEALTVPVMAAALVEGWSQYLSANLTSILAVLAGMAVFMWYW